MAGAKRKHTVACFELRLNRNSFPTWIFATINHWTRQWLTSFLGLYALYHLTRTNRQLSILLEDFDGNKGTANYSNFHINGEDDSFRLYVSIEQMINQLEHPSTRQSTNLPIYPSISQPPYPSTSYPSSSYPPGSLSSHPPILLPPYPPTNLYYHPPVLPSPIHPPHILISTSLPTCISFSSPV